LGTVRGRCVERRALSAARCRFVPKNLICLGERFRLVRLALDFFRNTTRRGFESFFVLVTVIGSTLSYW
jgi:hypothetical protein